MNLLLGIMPFMLVTLVKKFIGKLNQRKEITLDDSWFDYVIHRTDDEEQFMKDIDSDFRKNY